MSTAAPWNKVDNFSAVSATQATPLNELSAPEADIVAKNIVWALLKTGQWSATIQNGQARMKLLRRPEHGATRPKQK